MTGKENENRETSPDPEDKQDPEVVAHSDDSEDAPCIIGHSGSCTSDMAE